VLLSFVKWPPSPARLAACPATLIVSCCDFKNLQTLFHPGHPPLQLTLFSSSVSTLFCICSKAASFRSFVFLHLHTLFHSFAKSDSLSPVLSVVCALFAKRRGYTPARISAYLPPCRFRYNLSPCLVAVLSRSLRAFRFRESPIVFFIFRESP